MANEIKELIDNIKKIIEENRKNDFNHIILQSTSMKQLLDYITNLQKKIKNLDLDLDSYKSKYNNIKLHYEELAKENKKLQQRKGKAFKYIQDNFTNEDGSVWHEDFKIIKDILQD